MTKELRLLAFLSIFFALFLIAGGPLLVFQGIAWGNMIRTYSKTETWSSALEKTFSGKYRCSLCQRIAEEKQKEKKTESISTSEKSLKAALFSQEEASSFVFLKKNPYPPSTLADYQGISQEPPTPYPRGILLA